MSVHELAAIHGRFQPFHNGHLGYLRDALDRASTVIVGITNPFARSVTSEPTDDHRHLPSSNPLTYFERVDIITTAIERCDASLLRRVRIVPFDLWAPDWDEAIPIRAVQVVTPDDVWDLEKARRFAAAGYKVEYLPTPLNRVTATRVRELLDTDDDAWRSLVPPGSVEALERLFTYKHWRGRMKASEDFWEKKHRKYVTNDWSEHPNFLVEEILDRLPEGARVLDLGAGTGRDSHFLAERGFDVSAADFSQYALDHFAPEAARLGIEQIRLDLSQTPYPFPDAAFDVVYAHLSLHYMDSTATAAAFAEIARLLRPGGRFFALVNSVNDPEYGTGTEIEPSYFELEPGDRKRYFATGDVAPLLEGQFRIVTCAYGTGTRKNANDQYVQVVAERT